MSAGCVYGWASPAELQLKSKDPPIGPESDPVSDEDISWLVAVPLLSGLFGTFVFGVLVDAVGRKRSGIIAAVPFIISWLLMAFCPGLTALYISRIIAGIGIGGSIVVAPMLVAETASDDLRGKLGTYPAVAINSGIVLGFIVGSVLAYHLVPLFLLILPTMLIICLSRIPESPSYLLKKDRPAEARSSLVWFRGDRRDGVVDDELDALKDAAAQNAAQSSVTFRDFICHKGTRRALIVNMGLVANQQFCGVLTVLNYAQSIFKGAGVANSAVASIIVGLLQAVCTYLSSGLINRVNRKVLLAWSNIVMGVSIAGLGGCFYAKSIGYDSPVMGWLPVVCLSTYITAFAFGIGPIPFVIMTDTFSIRVKGLASSIVMSTQLISAFICGKFYAPIVSLLGAHGAMFLFAGCCAVGLVFVTCYVIETRGKTLEQILLEYNGEQKQDGRELYLSVNGKKSHSEQIMNELNGRKNRDNQV